MARPPAEEGPPSKEEPSSPSSDIMVEVSLLTEDPPPSAPRTFTAGSSAEIQISHPLAEDSAGPHGRGKEGGAG